MLLILNLGSVLLAAWIIPTSRAIKLDEFSTKTLYKWSHDVNLPISLNRDNAIDYNNNKCEAVHVNALFRHGARNPTSGVIHNINTLYQKLLVNGSTTNFTDLENLYRTHIYDLATAGELIPPGIEELTGLGRRYGAMFNRILSSKRVEFKSSSWSRNKASSAAFYNGLAQSLTNAMPYKNNVDNDQMRFYDNCYNWQHSVVQNQTNLAHIMKYNNSTDIKNVARSVQSKLGHKIPLSSDELYLMYSLCAYEMEIFNSSLWCDVMTDADREILEYGNDMQFYYESSYGHPLNSRMACPLVQDIFHTMDSSLKTIHRLNNTEAVADSYVAGKFQFGHSETLVQLITALELFKDSEPLLETNRAAMADRKFKTSKVASYSGNVAMVLYVCDDVRRTAVLRMYSNEQTVINPACGQTECLYEQVKRHYTDLINHCSHAQICTMKDPTSPIIGK